MSPRIVALEERLIFKLPQTHWFFEDMLTIELPLEWNVSFCPMNGYQDPTIREGDVRSALSRPIGTRSLGDLAKGKGEAVIIFDDLTRPTRAYEIIPHIIGELKKNGISSDHIRLVSALGAHGAMTRIDFAKKLGEEIVEEYPVYNHNPFHNLTDLGETSRGTPVTINSEVMACDLKIGVGCVVPHVTTGFSGGGKIVCPGIAGIETIAHNHGKISGIPASSTRLPSSVGVGMVDTNPCRLDIEEIAEKAKLDIKIDVIVNGEGKSTKIFVGDPVQEHRVAVQVARVAYSTKALPKPKPDIIVANTSMRANEAQIAFLLWSRHVKKGGSLVIIANAPDGQVTHYLIGKFGRNSGGPLYAPSLCHEDLGRIIVCSSYVVRDPFLPITDPHRITWVKTWNEVLEELKKAHPPGATVAVIPNADTQYLNEILR
jgi:nickel-dependent lactate racemase